MSRTPEHEPGDTFVRVWPNAACDGAHYVTTTLCISRVRSGSTFWFDVFNDGGATLFEQEKTNTLAMHMNDWTRLA